MRKKKTGCVCTIDGCWRWEYAQRHRVGDLPECEHCGFNLVEAQRREKLPLTPMPCGLRRKLVSLAHE